MRRVLDPTGVQIERSVTESPNLTFDPVDVNWLSVAVAH
jgi:hypothetical protein